ncbi:MAG: Omp28-related outer membrane protein [Candidatus Kapabacteria bacterium]|nr:Omp28-related outer membrane protein [Candidatus Kapabacteria bacterium]
MSTSFTKVLRMLTILSFVVLFAATSPLEAQKRVLIEQHTGAWCGWCPDGSYRVSEVLKEFPDQVIGVKWHNGDAMQIPEQQTIAQSFGITGYPQGIVDRTVYNGGMALNRGDWRGAAIARLNAPPIFKLELDYSYNATTEMITATIRAEVLTNDPRQFAFNVYVMEDKVSGPNNNQWNQQNYLSNRPGFEDNPYYKQPSVIVGYEHMSVVRNAFGGAYGDTQKFQKGVKAGEEYTQTFSMKKAADWKPQDLYVVGLVQAFVVSGQSLTDGSIVNAIEVGKKMPAFAKLETDLEYTMMTLGQDFSHNIVVSNPQDFELEVDLSIDAAESNYPSNWAPTLSKTKVILPAKGETEVILNLNAPDGRPNFATFTVKATPVSKNNIEVASTNTQFNVLTDNTKHLVFGLNPNAELFKSALAMNLDYGMNMVYMPLPRSKVEAALNAYQAGNFDFIYISSSYNTRGLFSTNWAEATLIRNYLKDAVNAGKKILLSSELDMHITFNTTDGSADAKAFFGNTLGIGSATSPLQLVQTNQQGQITGYFYADIQGVSGDPIGNGMTFSINKNAGTAANKRLFFAENLTASGAATAFLNYTSPAGIAGVKSQVGNSRIVYLSFNFEAADDQVKSKLASEIMDWLFAEPQTTAPAMTLSTQELDFGTVHKGEYEVQSFILRNVGNAPLTFTKIELQDNAEGTFTITEGGSLASLGEGGTRTIEVKFSPDNVETTTNYSANLVIQSNDPNNPNATITMEGIGVDPASVDEVVSVDGLFSMSVGPNPVNTISTFNYTINGTAAQFINVKMIDASGRTIQQIVKESLAPGTFNAEINAGNLTSGTYYIMAEINGVTTQMPVVVVK